MTQETLDFLVVKTNELIQSSTCSEEAKLMAKKWLESMDTPLQDQTTIEYINELEEDIVTIDGLIAFSSSKSGKENFGEELASNILNHALEIKEKGAQYCDCPACTIVLEILEKKEEILK